MKLLQLSFFGDVNLGLYAKVSDEFCFVGNFLSGSIFDKLETVLKTKILKTSIANTDLVGIFSVLNSNGMLIPSIATQNELKILKSQLNAGILKTKFTAIGNLILVNDKGAVISAVFSQKEKKIIEDVLDVETVSTTIAQLNNIGSCGVATNRGCLLHRDAREEEIKTVEDVLKVKVDIGTANFGSPFVGSCLLANSRGALVGASTTGPEVVRIMEALGFV